MALLGSALSPRPSPAQARSRDAPAVAPARMKVSHCPGGLAQGLDIRLVELCTQRGWLFLGLRPEPLGHGYSGALPSVVFMLVHVGLQRKVVGRSQAACSPSSENKRAFGVGD